MRLFILGLMLGLAIIAPVSAARMFEPMSQGPKVVAGVVAGDGTIESGSGFTVRHHGLGQYEVRFQNGVLPGCGAMAVTDLAQGYEPAIAAVGQANCGHVFHVSLWLPDEHVREDHAFQFIATQAI